MRFLGVSTPPKHKGLAIWQNQQCSGRRVLCLLGFLRTLRCMGLCPSDHNDMRERWGPLRCSFRLTQAL